MSVTCLEKDINKTFYPCIAHITRKGHNDEKNTISACPKTVLSHDRSFVPYDRNTHYQQGKLNRSQGLGKYHDRNGPEAENRDHKSQKGKRHKHGAIFTHGHGAGRIVVVAEQPWKKQGIGKLRGESRRYNANDKNGDREPSCKRLKKREQFR